VRQDLTVPLCLPGLLAQVAFLDGGCHVRCLKGDLSGWEVRLTTGGPVTVTVP